MSKVKKKRATKKINKKPVIKQEKAKDNTNDVKFSKGDEFIYSCFMGLKKVWKIFYGWWHPKKISTKILIINFIILIITGFNLSNEIKLHGDIIYRNLLLIANKQPYNTHEIYDFTSNILIFILLAGVTIVVVIYKTISSIFNAIKGDYDPFKASLQEARKQVKLKL